MIWRLRLFGLEIASVERDDDEPPPDGITGGSMHNFDRDDNPLNPDDRYDWDIEDRKFGFS